MINILPCEDNIIAIYSRKYDLLKINVTKNAL